MCLKVIENGKYKDVFIKEGEVRADTLSSDFCFTLTLIYSVQNISYLYLVSC